MFDIIPLKRYNHLVGNSRSKVWAKHNTQTAVPWKTHMECLMVRKDMPACYCHIMSWSNKEMFVAHWMIYHIDQHTSHIVCEHQKDGVPCHYITDREADMKKHIHKPHNPALKEKITTNWYVKENAWLDVTSSWSIKDIEKR